METCHTVCYTCLVWQHVTTCHNQNGLKRMRWMLINFWIRRIEHQGSTKRHGNRLSAQAICSWRFASFHYQGVSWVSNTSGSAGSSWIEVPVHRTCKYLGNTSQDLPSFSMPCLWVWVWWDLFLRMLFLLFCFFLLGLLFLFFLAFLLFKIL